MAHLTRSDVDYVEDPHTAARMHLELRHQIDHDGATNAERAEGKAALTKLHQTWPDAPKVAAEASEDQLGGLPAHLKRTRDQHRREFGVTAQGARAARQRRGKHPTRPAAPAKPRPAARASAGSSRRRSSRSTPGPSASDVADWAAPGAVDAGQFAWQVFGWGVGLSLAYLLLSNSEKAPRGRSAVELISRGVSNTVATLVSPLGDPLSPTTTVPRRTR